ncbi:MAG: hypothetical protein ACYSUX_15355 [Planctomycetota bacterium]|jgi:hypothetical protein
MENTSGTINCRRLLAFLVIILLLATPTRSKAATKKNIPHLIRIPLELCDKSDSHEQGWKVVQFRNKLPNKVVSDKDGLHIGVECSVSLLGYCLNEPAEVNSVLLQGSVTGLPGIEKNKRQGDKKADDFAIRFGLVISGTKKLGPMDKLFAPELVKRLCGLAPNSKGIDHVLFLNLANDPPPKWRNRIHPIGKGLLREQVGLVKNEPGDFTLKVEFQKPYTVLALCIISDGDDTKSKYRVTIRNIQLNPKKRKICTEAKS